MLTIYCCDFWDNWEFSIARNYRIKSNSIQMVLEKKFVDLSLWSAISIKENKLVSTLNPVNARSIFSSISHMISLSTKNDTYKGSYKEWINLDKKQIRMYTHGFQFVNSESFIMFNWKGYKCMGYRLKFKLKSILMSLRTRKTL